MTVKAPESNASSGPAWVNDLVRAEPKAPLMVPFMAYLILIGVNDLLFKENNSVLAASWQPVWIAVHIAVAGWVTWLFRHHYPPWGHRHLGIAVVVGVLAAGLWVGGQHLLDGIMVGGRSLGGALSVSSQAPFLTLKVSQPVDPHGTLGNGALFWVQIVLKICRAVTIVPIVEELFWRGFILRAFVRWDWFDRVPWGSFSWRAFLGSAILSVAEHPASWGVSIACWLLYNGLFYWKKSLWCLILTHAITNLVLYVYVVSTGDWRFW